MTKPVIGVCEVNTNLQDALESVGKTKSNNSDEGWGWVVTFGGFTISWIMSIAMVSFGVVYSTFLQDIRTSGTLSAWIYTIAMVNANIVGYMFGPLVDELGWRTVAFVSGLLYAAGFIMSAFSTTAWFLLFSFSFVTGSSIRILLDSATLVITHYFTSWRTLAISIALSGIGVGQMVMAPVITMLLEEYGFRGATLILGGIALNCCVAAMVFHPVEWHRKNSHTIITGDSKKEETTVITTKRGEESCLRRILRIALTNMKMFKSSSVSIVASKMALSVSVFFNVFTTVPFAMQQEGFGARESSFCILVAGGCNLGARVLTAFLSCCPKLRVRIVFTCGVFLAAIALIGFNVAENLIGKCTALGLIGASYGMTTSLSSLLIIDELGLHMLPSALSINSLLTGIYILIIGPLVGVIRDLSGSYVASLYFCVVVFLLCGVHGLLIPVAFVMDQHRDTALHQKASHHQHTEHMAVQDILQHPQQTTSGDPYQQRIRQAKPHNEKSSLIRN